VRVRSIPLLFLALLLCGCHARVSDMPVGKAVEISIPLGLPSLSIPKDNPPTIATIALGRELFYDKRLSQNDTLACSSCHNPQMAFSDGERLSKGVMGQRALRNSPTVLNAAYSPSQFWDGRAQSLEAQSAAPISDPLEMNQPHAVSFKKIADNANYRAMFREAFGTDDVTLARIEKSLASFERTLLSGDSTFDRYQYARGKDAQPDALTVQQVRGFAVFMNPMRGNCAACHMVGSQSALFADGKFHNTGEGVGENSETFSDVGRFAETHVATDTGAFKTPTLRNVALTAPYMHDGKLKTLKEVVDFYAGGGNSNPYLDAEMKKIHMTPQDREDLVEFLQALNGSMPANSGPPAQ